MDYKQIIDKLVRELSYRVGIPNIHNKEHQSIMSEILSEWGEYDVKQTIFEFLTEKDDAKIDPDTEVTYRNKDGDTRKTTYANAIKNDKESPQYKAADALRNRPRDKDGNQTKQKSMFNTAAEKQKREKEKKIADKIEKEKGSDSKSTEDEVKAGIPNQKDKTLTDVDTKSTDIYTNEDTGVTDEDFNNDVNSIYENSADRLKSEDLDEYFNSGKIPKKYQTVIARLVNSENGKQKITDYMSGVGAGQLQSQAGEILTMAGIGMNDEEFDGFISKLEEQVSKYPKGSKPVVTKEWLESVRHVRSVTNKRYDSQFGKGNWEIEASAWDVPNEFEALGNSDYNKNKGFSSDMYVKVSVNGKPVLDEISLKKDTTANIYNGVVTDIKNWSSNVPESADIDAYKKGELERPQQYGKNAQQLQVDRKILTSEAVTKNKELRTTLNALGVISGTAAKGYKLEPKAEEIITKLESMPVPPPIDLDRFKQTFNTGDKTRYKKFLIMHAACQRAKEISEGNTEKTTAGEFLNNHIGYEKGEDGKFPQGSIKRYQNDTIQFLVDDEEAKEGCLTALAEKLPMKSLLEGEEKMAIGGLSADPKTLQRVFGIDNYEDFKAGLTMKEDEDGNNFLVYRS